MFIVTEYAALKHLLLLATCVIMRCVIEGLMRDLGIFVKGGGPGQSD